LYKVKSLSERGIDWIVKFPDQGQLPFKMKGKNNSNMINVKSGFKGLWSPNSSKRQLNNQPFIGMHLKNTTCVRRALFSALTLAGMQQPLLISYCLKQLRLTRHKTLIKTTSNNQLISYP